MKFILGLGILLFCFAVPVSAQDFTNENLVKALVVEIVEEGEKTIDVYSEKYTNVYQIVRLKILDGEDTGIETVIDHGGTFSVHPSALVKEGQIVVLTQTETPDGLQYQIIDKYRLNELGMIALFFLFLVLVLSRWKGVGSFLGMILSLLVIVKFIVPQILAGKDPLFISIIGSVFILVTTIYLAHGFSKQTTTAVVSTALTLIMTGLLSVAFVSLTSLSGLADEDASTLLFGPTSTINFKGLLLGGMIIGFLGVLDDVTTGIAATVFELKKVNSKLKMGKLITSSMNVGREHISSLVNTLVLAYAGASLPLFLYIILNPQGYPMWFVINSELIAEEIVRTLVGSIGLLFAVPITAVLAAWVTTGFRDGNRSLLER